ncbi:MAG: RES family NAD+ phosphorylase [Gemmatimonadota bacterium]|nr:RES family NAD+ phosphorylase [Gemmatimonadota bacterium]
MPAASTRGGTVRLWRVFPWDRRALPGQAYSPASVAPRQKQGGGRFDLPELISALYLAETPEHGYAEFLQDFRTQILTRAHLKRNWHPLAHVSVDVPLEVFHSLPDLADPETLQRYDIRPDVLSLPRPHRRTTQAIARQIWDDSQAGLRWWSAFHGEWHTTVLFTERVPLDLLNFGTPTVATLRDPAVVARAHAAGMRLRGSHRPGL